MTNSETTAKSTQNTAATESTSQPQTLLPSHPMITRAKSGIYKPKIYTVKRLAREKIDTPASVEEALKNKKWETTMREKFEALQKNRTWELVPPSRDLKVVGNKWVYKVKYNPDGTIARYKARPVAKGFHQTAGIDFNETFSPVAKSPTIRIVLNLAVMNNWDIKQVDVNNAFLHGELCEEVFIRQPQGFEDKRKPQYVCKLKKALYGLKQAPRAWYNKLSSALKDWGFKNSISDTSLFFINKDGDTVLLLVYVDDILLTGSNSRIIDDVIQKLNKSFSLKDLGSLKYFLGIEVERIAEGMHLSQGKYITDLLQRT
ncbi:hypothetical protein KPL70_015204 [Citrus sinensis]|nr:hypothetical protein KPL70_015204 [Citrus sinensis]